MEEAPHPTTKTTQHERGGSVKSRRRKHLVGDDVCDLEKELESLCIEPTKNEKVEASPKRTVKPRSAKPKTKSSSKTKSVNNKSDERPLEDRIEALTLDSVAPVQAAVTKSQRKPPKTLKTLKNEDIDNSAEPIAKTTCEHDNVYANFVSALLSLSDQRQIIPFEQWSAELEPHFTITKIAEASFSEVYRLAATSTIDGHKQESVLKMIALKTPPNAPLPSDMKTRGVRDRKGNAAKEMAKRAEKDEWKSNVADVLSEVKLLQNLNHIPGFTVFRDLTLVQGKPSSMFSKAWTAWNKSRPRGRKSEFPDPSKKASYDEMQLWAVIEMQDAGTDCEKIMEMDGLASIWEVWDVFWGVCLSVAKAEEACRFEHRDLHLGNICIRSSCPKDEATQSRVQDPLQRKLHFTSLEITVIDYTLSRADIVLAPSRRSSSVSSISNSTASSFSSLEPDVAYLDLNKDPALFEGDASEEYQYEIYRYMRGAALHDKPLVSSLPEDTEPPVTPHRSPRKNTHIHFDELESPRRSPRKHTATVLDTFEVKDRSNDLDIWQKFHPKTNLVWAHYLLYKLLEHLELQDSIPDHVSTGAITAIVRLNSNDDAQKVVKKAMKLYKVLQKVNELLSPKALGQHDGLGSMKELVVLALEERWLRVDDVAG